MLAQAEGKEFSIRAHGLVPQRIRGPILLDICETPRVERTSIHVILLVEMGGP